MGPRSNNQAPGHPDIPARWTSSAKSGVGTAPPVVSRVWFTLSHSILDEIYYPRVDYACTRESFSTGARYFVMRGDRLGGPPGALLLARAGAKWRPQPATCGPWYWRCPLSH